MQLKNAVNKSMRQSVHFWHGNGEILLNAFYGRAACIMLCVSVIFVYDAIGIFFSLVLGEFEKYDKMFYCLLVLLIR